VAAEAAGGLERLGRLVGEDTAAVEVVLAALALEDDPLLAAGVARETGLGTLAPGTERGPSPALLASLAGVSLTDAFAADGPIWQLAVLTPSVPLAALGLDPRFAPAHVPGHWRASLAGGRALSHELAPFARRLLPPAAGGPPPPHVDEDLVASAGATLAGEAPGLLLEAEAGVTHALAGLLARPLLVLDGGALAAAARAPELLRIVLAEAQLYEELLAVRGPDALLVAHGALLARLLTEHGACVLVERAAELVPIGA
jgi:hypothetical protein